VRRTFAGIGFAKPPLRYLGYALLVPAVYCAAIYLPVWLSGVGTFRGAAVLLHGIGASAFYLPCAFFLALGEEIGWRGVLTPNLAKIAGPVRAGLATGAVWALWHYLDILYFGYNENTPAPYAIACFSISVIGLALFLAWLRLASGSIWPPALFHAAHNMIIHGVFDRATAPNGLTAYLTTEFGAGLAITSTMLGLVVLPQLRSLKTTPTVPSAGNARITISDRP
jgi:membrane protease YdiL (CAAX protease family)